MSLKRKSTEIDSKEKEGKKIKSSFEKDIFQGGFSSVLSAQIQTDFPRGGGSDLNGITEGKVKNLEKSKRPPKDKSALQKKKRLEKNPLKERTIISTTRQNIDHLRVEHLNYKRCLPGVRILAEIIRIMPLEIIVSLPNQLLGHIPITNISSYFTTLLAAEAANSDSDSGSDQESMSIASLDDMFHVGQLLTVAVASSKSSDTARKTLTAVQRADDVYRMSRRLELSVDPAVVHQNVTKSDLVQSYSLLASVKSIEDNGYILDLGIEGTTAFCSFGEGKKAGKDKALSLGQLVSCSIIKASANGKTCTVSVHPFDSKPPRLTNPPSLKAILPGSLVQCLVTAVIGNGLNVKFLGLFDGTIDTHHTGHSASVDLASVFKVGKKLNARILWTAPTDDSDQAAAALTLLPHLVDTKNDTAALEEAFPRGRILEAVHVTKVEPDYGVSCDIQSPDPDDPPVKAFAHISHISDEHIQTVHSSLSNFTVGSAHSARVIGYSTIDQIVQLSFEPSVLDAKFMTVAEVQPGEVVKGTISSLTPTALFVNIGGHIDAMVPALHFSDIQLQHPERKFKAGATVKGKVFAVDENRSRITLTLKKTLIKSELAVLLPSTTAQIGLHVHAVVVRIDTNALFVDTIGGRRLLIPLAEASDAYIKSLADDFFVGQVVQARIITIKEDGRLTASLRSAHPKADHEAKTFTVAIVNEVQEKGLLLGLSADQTGFLSYSAIAKVRQISRSAAQSLFVAGDSLHNLESKSVGKNGTLVLSWATNTTTGESLASPSLFTDVRVGQIVSGKIVSKVANNYTVQITRGLKGRLHYTDAATNYDDAASLEVGSTVECRVVAIDAERKFINLSIRSPDETDLQVRDAQIESIDDLDTVLVTKRTIRGFVKHVSDAGLFVSLSRELTARVMISHLFDDYVKEWKERFQDGQIVEGKLLAVDNEKKQIEMSLKKNPTKTKANEGRNPLVNYKVGQKVHCVVKREEKFGFFLRIEGTSVSGLCHRSEILDGDDKKWEKALSQGQEVQAVIIELDIDKPRISFSVKPSRLGDVRDSDAEMKDNDAESVINDEADHESEHSEVLDEVDTVMDSQTSQSFALTSAPKSAAQPVEEFERLLLGQPNSSLLWIQYMSHYLEDGQITEARKISRRALSTVDYRQQNEKQNIWTAMINLETTYGDEDSLEAVFKQAIEANDAEAMYLRLVQILQDAGKHDLASEYLQEAVKKHGQSVTLWTAYASHLMAHQNIDDGRDLLQQALRTLPPRSHVETTSKFAQLEFRLGDPERGRTIFEGILSSHPRHLDILAVYIDMEVKQKEFAKARVLYQRAVALQLSSKKAKWLFKRFLSFAQEHGSAEEVEEVKRLATQWVETHSESRAD